MPRAVLLPLLPPLALAAAISAGVVACGDAPAPPDPTCGGAAPYAARGPYSVGVVTLTRGSTVVEVWYPAAAGAAGPGASYDLRDWLPEDLRARIPDSAPTTYAMDAVRDAPLGGAGALPVALFSHGLAAYRSQSSFLTAHLASWGFVVAAPDHPERGLARLLSSQAPDFSRGPDTLRETLAVLAADPRFAGRLDRDRRAVLGHSAGGGVAGIVARDPEVQAWVAMASGGFREVPAKPTLVLGADRDELVPPSSVRDGYDALVPPGRRLRMLRGFGHLAFSDICLIGREQGGIVQIARDHGIEVADFLVTLAQDGCRPGDVPAERGFPAIRHYVTASLRAGLGLDAQPRGLDAAGDACFAAYLSESKQD